LEALELIELLTFPPGGSGCGLSVTFEPGGSGCGLIFTLDPGGSGCGLSITLDPGDPTDPDLAVLPETMMIDLAPPDCVDDCANTSFEAAGPGFVDVSADNGSACPPAAKAKFAARTTDDKTHANDNDFMEPPPGDGSIQPSIRTIRSQKLRFW
jgi:hypothetical protein